MNIYTYVISSYQHFTIKTGEERKTKSYLSYSGKLLLLLLVLLPLKYSPSPLPPLTVRLLALSSPRAQVISGLIRILKGTNRI